MRIYGSIHTTYWTHPEIQKLSDQAKLLGAYLLSCSHTTMLGCFRLPIGYIAEDLRWSFEAVSSALNDLGSINFLSYDAEHAWVFIHKFLKHNQIENPNQGRSIVKLFDAMPKQLNFILAFINIIVEHDEHLPEEFINSLLIVSQPFLNQEQDQYQEQEQNQVQDQEFLSGKPDLPQSKDFYFKKQKSQTRQESRKAHKSQALEILKFLNEKTGKYFRDSEANLDLIIARLKSGVTLGQCFQIIAKKCREWHDDADMAKYLRPETLFNKKKFESYLAEVSVISESEASP